MRIAFLCPALPGARLGKRHTLSGGTQYDAELCDALKTRQHRVSFVETPPDAPDTAVERRAARLVAQQFDVILQDGLGFRSYTQLNRSLRRRACKARLVAVMHGPAARLQPESGVAAAERAYLQTVDGVLTPSHASRTACTRLAATGTPIAVVPPGTALFWQSEPPRTLAPQPAHLVSVGHVTPTKRYLDLIDVLARLHRLEPALPWSVTIAGRLDVDPAYVKAVRWRLRHHELEKRVSLVGALTETQLKVLFGKASANLNTASWESWGMALAEGLRSGVPLFSWAAGGLWEFAPLGRAAWRVPFLDHLKFARWLHAFMHLGAVRRQRVRKAAFSAGMRLPTWDETARDAERFLLKILARPRPPAPARPTSRVRPARPR